MPKQPNIVNKDYPWDVHSPAYMYMHIIHLCMCSSTVWHHFKSQCLNGSRRLAPTILTSSSLYMYNVLWHHRAAIANTCTVHCVRHHLFSCSYFYVTIVHVLYYKMVACTCTCLFVCVTFPLWPLRLTVFSNEKVEYTCTRLELLAANKWPPLLKQHCREKIETFTDESQLTIIDTHVQCTCTHVLANWGIHQRNYMYICYMYLLLYNPWSGILWMVLYHQSRCSSIVTFHWIPQEGRGH